MSCLVYFQKPVSLVYLLNINTVTNTTGRNRFRKKNTTNSATGDE